MIRATDMGLQPPDPSVLIKGLDQLVKVVLPENQDIAFRVSMLRYNMEVDTRPTVEGAKGFASSLDVGAGASGLQEQTRIVEYALCQGGHSSAST